METKEIYAALKTKSETNKCFFGVFPIDMLPDKKTIKYDRNGIAFIVVNLDPSYKSGSHWVCLKISPLPYEYNEYFDSFGKQIPKKIQAYLECNYLSQNKQLQNENTSICGQWCIYYIWQRNRKYTMSQIINKFDKNTFNNDKIVNASINKNFTGKPQDLQDMPFLIQQFSKALKDI